MGALTYEQRMMRDRVCLNRIVRPTPADAAATVYYVTCAAWHGHSQSTFPVLALDAAHAKEMARLSCVLKGEPLEAENEPDVDARPQASIDLKEGILLSEHPDLCDLRQRRYREREAS